MDNQHVISTINEVIETCKDGEMGFRTCAEHIDDSEIKAMLMERARHCAESASELQNEVRRLEAIRIRTVASQVSCIGGG